MIIEIIDREKESLHRCHAGRKRKDVPLEELIVREVRKKEYSRKYYLENREKKLLQAKQYRIANRERILEKSKNITDEERRLKNLETKIWYAINRDSILLKRREKQKNWNPEQRKARTQYYKNWVAKKKNLKKENQNDNRK